MRSPWQHRKALGRLAQITWNYGLLRREAVNYAPYRLWVEPTSRCNLACTMCPNKDFPESDLGFMDMALYRQIIDEAKDFVHDINLHHRGESTLHPELPEMIGYADAAGMKVKLHTNGTTLTEALSEKLLSSGLRLISFSFDGYTAQTYESIRVRANFERTLGNIHRFLEMRRERGVARLRAVMEVIDFDAVRQDSAAREAFVHGLKSRGLDRLIIKPPHNWAGNVSLETGETVSFSPCTFPWHALVICWDGKTGSCPHDFFAKIEYGNVKDQSLKELFNSEGIRQLRRQMLSKNINQIDSPCRECDSIRRKRLLGIPVSSLKYLRD
ncbi:radical SAM protein [bacterium]|nr:radical SAM protein [bacterium]